MTARQRAVLEAFRELNAKFGEPPSVRKVAAHFGIQVSAAHRHLRKLVKWGVLESRNGSIRLPGASVLPVPIVGRVPAGFPQEPVEAPDGFLPCPAEWGKSASLFAVRVRGDSMIGAGILDSDLVVCAKAESAKEGEIVVALVDGEATVKRLGRWQGGPALIAANPKYKPISLKGDSRVIARVLGVFRSLKT